MDKQPKVGIAVIIQKNDKVLLGKRKNAHGAGSWAFPGGHLEFGESWEDCGRREVDEETGISIKNIHFWAATNDIFKEEGKHYITIFMLSDFDFGEVKLKEPEKCEGWEWFSWKNLPQPLFIPIQNLLKTAFSLF